MPGEGRTDDRIGGLWPRRQGWLIAAAVLSPFLLVLAGSLVAALLGVAGAAMVTLGAWDRDASGVGSGARTLNRAALVLDATWSSPGARLLEFTPFSLGLVDDVRAATGVLAAASDGLPAAAEIATTVLGLDGEPLLQGGAGVDIAGLERLAGPVDQVHEAMLGTATALDLVPRSGILGGTLGSLSDRAKTLLLEAEPVVRAAAQAWPDLPQALGSETPQRYLVCALNDAELFGSGGAPLFATMVEVAQGAFSIPISGQLESELSPGNPPIEWEPGGGRPWYEEGKRYPFVNSNFHPDFRTAGPDMARAWAALGYPEVRGVLTIDVHALARVLDWIGPIEVAGYGRLTSANLVREVLVDSYREFPDDQGLAERRGRNEALAEALVGRLSQPGHLVDALRGVREGIPGRHVQAWFDSPSLQAGAAALGATGALSEPAGDVLGAFSQNAPSKLAVFQQRDIVQEVTLTPGGGARVVRTVRFTNDVPRGLEGDATQYRGYLALLSRIRVAHRVPDSAEAARVTVEGSRPIVRRAVGPHPDGRGGMMLWQGHDTSPGETAVVQVRYTLPNGTFDPGQYRLVAEPQALHRPVALRVLVHPVPGLSVPVAPGWSRIDGSAEWVGTLDRPLDLALG